MVEDFKALRVIPEGPVLRVELNSPETGNAVSGLILDELLAVLGTLQDETGVRVLILSGAGPDFCLGGDRREFGELLAADPGGAELRALANKARRVCDALATANAVTIARLQGGVIGAGMALAVFCDLRVGADTCRFRLPELALGMPPAWGGALPRLLNETGAARIRELILTGAASTRRRRPSCPSFTRSLPRRSWTTPSGSGRSPCSAGPPWPCGPPR